MRSIFVLQALKKLARVCGVIFTVKPQDKNKQSDEIDITWCQKPRDNDPQLQLPLIGQVLHDEVGTAPLSM